MKVVCVGMLFAALGLVQPAPYNAGESLRPRL